MKTAQELLAEVKQCGIPACLMEDGRLHVADIFLSHGRLQQVLVTLPADEQIVATFLSRQ